MKRLPYTSAWLSLLIMAVPACSVLPERSPQATVHDFGPWQGDETRAHWSTVEITAPDWLQEDRIRYRLLYANPTAVRFYTQDRWVAPAPALLAQRLRAAAGRDGYRLLVELQSFEQVFDRPGHSSVIVDFRAKAWEGGTSSSETTESPGATSSLGANLDARNASSLRANPGEGRSKGGIPHEGVFRLSVPTPTADAAGAVAAFAEAIQSGMKELDSWLGSLRTMP
jgi:cholesterol transport system auxiliary component